MNLQIIDRTTNGYVENIVNNILKEITFESNKIRKKAKLILNVAIISGVFFILADLKLISCLLNSTINFRLFTLSVLVIVSSFCCVLYIVGTYFKMKMDYQKLKTELDRQQKGKWQDDTKRIELLNELYHCPLYSKKIYDYIDELCDWSNHQRLLKLRKKIQKIEIDFVRYDEENLKLQCVYNGQNNHLTFEKAWLLEEENQESPTLVFDDKGVTFHYNPDKIQVVKERIDEMIEEEILFKEN